MKAQFVLCVAVLVVAAQALTDEQKEKIKTYHKECSDSTKVDPELVKKARAGNFVEDPTLKEFLLCFSKKAGFQNEEGALQSDVLLTKIKPEINDDAAAEALVKKCAVQKDTPQETAFTVTKCYYENSPSHISITN